ncbi:MAG: hypothetical protein WBD71_01460 [Xanthobacteraceae bacterium]
MSVVVVRWMCRRYDVAGRRGLQALFAAIGGVAGVTAFFLLGPVFALIHPARAREIGAAIGHGARIGSAIIMVATLSCIRFYARPKPQAPAKPKGDVREQLLKAREQIQWRIEGVQSNPQYNYRGGVPETDVIISELAEKLAEIDKVLAELDQKNA